MGVSCCTPDVSIGAFTRHRVRETAYANPTKSKRIPAGPSVARDEPVRQALGSMPCVLTQHHNKTMKTTSS